MCVVQLSMNTDEQEQSPMDDSGHGEGSDGETEEDEEPKICQVCGDKSTGYHFNAMTCEGCKGFFRRAMKRPAQLGCPFQNTCVITKSNRRQCQACRLHKCLSIGMKRELIMSDEAVEKRRMQIKRKKMLEEPITLSLQQEEVIKELLSAHQKTFDMTCAHFVEFRPLDREKSEYREEEISQMKWSVAGPCSTIASSSSYASNSRHLDLRDVKRLRAYTAMPHFADLTTYMIKNIINFSKTLKMFSSLVIEDQISLLKGATFEILLIHFNMFFNERSGIWECGPLQYNLDDLMRGGFQRHLLDRMMNFHCTLRKLNLRVEEYVLMQAISLFSPDRPGITHCSVVDHNQELLALALKTFTEAKRSEPEKQLLYPKIIACLTEMRSMNEEYTKQMLEIKDITPDVSPLMLEIISNDG